MNMSQSAAVAHQIPTYHILNVVKISKKELAKRKKKKTVGSLQHT